MLISAANATSVRKPFAAIRRAGGSCPTSGSGGGAPVNRLRQTATTKQKALNRTRREPVMTIIHSGTTPSKSFFAPIPLASEASPVRIQAA